MNSEFKDRLRTAMELRNIKPVELAEKTGLSKARISQYLNGIYTPKSKGTYLIAVALNVSETWLMGFNVSMERNSKQDNLINCADINLTADEQKLIEVFRSLNKEGQEKLLDLADDFIKSGKYKKSTANELDKLKA